MYNLFEYFYNYGSNGGMAIYYSWAFLYVILAVFIAILFIVFLIVAIKTKKKWAIATSVVLFLISYPALTPFFEIRAFFKSYDLKIFDVQSLNAYKNVSRNEKSFSNNMEIAAKLSLFPSQKGFIYILIGNQSSNHNDAIKYFDKAYKYLKNYKSENWQYAVNRYYMAGDFDKVIEIANAHDGWYYSAASAYIMKNDYTGALDAVNKELLHHPKAPNAYSQRALIYQNLNKNTAAKADYNKALQLCYNEKYTVEIQSSCASHVRETALRKSYFQEMWKKGYVADKKQGRI